jgi:hypothetical protein
MPAETERDRQVLELLDGIFELLARRGVGDAHRRALFDEPFADGGPAAEVAEAEHRHVFAADVLHAHPDGIGSRLACDAAAGAWAAGFSVDATA